MGKQILNLLREGKSYSEIVCLLGCSKSTINYYAKKLGTAKSRSVYNWQAVQEYHNQGYGMSQCIKQFGFGKDAWDKAVQ